MKKGLSYADSGVDIDKANQLVKGIKGKIKKTYTKGVLGDIGGFGGLFALDLKAYKEPVLVAGTDGVGTKLKIAQMLNKHKTIGIDLVAMCVNDILAQGAKPLFFLDYLATGKLELEETEDIIEGIVTGCKQAKAALIGGETAEMPGFYTQGQYDLAGFAVGIVDRKNIITGSTIKTGDCLIALPSSGLHSNGYSLVRKVFATEDIDNLTEKRVELGITLGEELLKPTRIYVSQVLPLLDKFNIKGIAHITGGGISENIERILPENVDAVVNSKSWPKPKIFDLLQKQGQITTKEMNKTFNMGLGMVLVVAPEEKNKVLENLTEIKEKAYFIGEIKAGKKRVIIKEGEDNS